MSGTGTDPRPFLSGILHGHEERILQVLPERVMSNLRTPSSENALVWNLLYPLARPTLSYKQFMELKPLWGTPALDAEEDELTPYFWGFDLAGHPHPEISHSVLKVDGQGLGTEIDVVLVGEQNLIGIEAKRIGGFGRCSRYHSGRCPEIHRSREGGPCRYWEVEASRFEAILEVGGRPSPDSIRPACERHYQLCRTLLVLIHTAESLNLKPSIWTLLPERGWRAARRQWLDFMGRVRDEEIWRRSRALSWESVRSLQWNVVRRSSGTK